MSSTERQDERFGDIAIKEQMVTREKIERALVIQRCISSRTKVYMPLGSVLLKMGLLTEPQIDEVLKIQNNMQPDDSAAASENTCSSQEEGDSGEACLNLTVSGDKLTATIAAVGDNVPPPPLEKVKKLIAEKEIVHGLISDQLMKAHLQKSPLPREPFVVAQGEPPVPGNPPEIRYYFDTDPLRIGTLLEDGSMDWKNRGDIPQVKPDELLAEKVGGNPGQPGTNIFGQEVLPPRIKEPPLKFTKGAGRSEDGKQIFSKVAGMPKLGGDGRIGVSRVLPIETEIGIETGNIEFDGLIEVNGGVASGYTVRGVSLDAKEIQNATIELSEDLVSDAGIYGSKVVVGGHLKASHLHNSTVEVLGDLLVDKEIFSCTIHVNGRCLIDNGKIIASNITAKKGVQVKDIGTEASKPSELTVGVDFKFERDMEAAKEELVAIQERQSECEAEIAVLKGKIDELDAQLGEAAQEQDGCMVQKRRLEEKIESEAVANNPAKRSMIEELVSDLAAKYDELDARIQQIMSRDDQVRAKIAGLEKEIKEIEERIEALREHMGILEEAAKVDPGVPVIKASGTVYSKTLVIGPHKKLIIPKEMQNVRIAESEEQPKQYAMKISNLR